ncbi:MAG: primosomal protein N' [Armatimonadota bacterium]|nr:primosomal protein N' [Armatimonadota bacterium]MDR7483827.1 primosomal protein N' [Armatimonadota bacterium]MDR7519019.1 primosomal protein N' [Armatimonadota bacterium]MDR7549202.1 primosomal protein N' [Armatimonadota bacterium]
MTPPPPLLVALDLPLRAGDAAFTFAAGAAAGAPRGAGVVVPFGRRFLPGIVLGPAPPREGLRPVLAMVDPCPLVPPPLIDLAEWVAREYLASVGEAIAAAVPWGALWSGLRLRCRAPVPGGLAPAVHAVAETLARRPLSLRQAERLLAHAPEAAAALAEARLVAATIRGMQDGQEAWNAPDPADPRRAGARGAAGGGSDAPVPCSATGRADAAVEAAMAGGPRALLFAGWRRTPAYLAAVRRAVAAGWSAIAAFGSTEAAAAFAGEAAAAGMAPVMVHGDLSPRARLAAWCRLSGAGGALAVGTRGAVFAPLADPALVIVDDEDASGHKEERAPRYVTGAVAAERTRLRGVLILGATTPTVMAYAAAQAGRLRLIALPSPRPRVGVIDLRRRPDPEEPVSRPLREAVRRTVRAGGRAVLLVDRKGYAGGLHCAECGAVPRCPRCATAMPYHRRERLLRCRLCGRTLQAPATCPQCGAARLHPLGAGTERIAAVVRQWTPAVWRFDSDVVRPGREAPARLAPLRSRGGVLVATPLVLPHLGGLRPDLVGVVAADRWLHRPEFRASERALALLRSVAFASQVRVLVETADPDHPAVRAAQSPTLRAFYAEELAQRQALGYPPFRVLAAVVVTAGSAAAAEAVCTRLLQAAAPSLDVFGPSPLPAAGGRRVARAMVLKALDRAAIRAALWPILVGDGVPRDVRITADVDPHDL